MGVSPAVRDARPFEAARRRRGRHPLGRADAPRPARLRPRLLERRTDSASVPRPRRPLRGTSVLGGTAGGDRARPALPVEPRRLRGSGRRAHGRGRRRSRGPRSRRRCEPRETRCSSSRCWPCSPTIPRRRTTPCRRRFRRSSPPASTGSSRVSGRCSSTRRSKGGSSTAARSRSYSRRSTRMSSAAPSSRSTRKELLRPDRSRYDDGFRFNHVLIRDVAYATMPKELRAELHGRLASWLEAHTGAHQTGQEEIVGYHLEQSYLTRAELGRAGTAAIAAASKGGRLLGRAGRRALDRGEFAAAASLLERACRLVAVEPAARAPLLCEFGVALRGTGALEAADAALLEAIEAARDHRDKATEQRAELERARLGRVAFPAGSRRAPRPCASGDRRVRASRQRRGPRRCLAAHRSRRALRTRPGSATRGARERP